MLNFINTIAIRCVVKSYICVLPWRKGLRARRPFPYPICSAYCSFLGMTWKKKFLMQQGKILYLEQKYFWNFYIPSHECNFDAEAHIFKIIFHMNTYLWCFRYTGEIRNGGLPSGWLIIRTVWAFRTENKRSAYGLVLTSIFNCWNGTLQRLIRCNNTIMTVFFI